MKRISLSLITLLVIVNAYSQTGQNEYEEWKPSKDEYANFDISKYFTPDVVRNQLDINFDLNSNYSHSNSNANNGDGYLSNWKISNSNLTWNMAPGFLRYVNTRKKITNFTINLSLNGSYVSQKDNYTSTSSSYLDNRFNTVSSNSLGLGWSNQWYFSKPFFMVYNISSDVSYNFTRDKTENLTAVSDQKQNQFVFNFSPQVGIGYGRIENVEDARQAVYIANALSKKNVLTRNLSNEELFELSQQISTVKNKRFLDSRLHLADEITTVDSFFVKNNLLSNNGAAYFTTLYDMWQYGALFSRRSGYEISFVAAPRYTYDNTKNTPELQNDYLYPQHRTYLETDLSFNYEKPVKLNWQHSVAVAGYAIFPEKQTESNSKYYYPKTFVALARYSLGYYPNTRTNIQGTVGQQIGRMTYGPDIVPESSTYYLALLGANVYYYISPYFRISGSYNLNYQHYLGKYNVAGSTKSNYFYTAFSIHLIYSIF